MSHDIDLITVGGWTRDELTAAIERRGHSMTALPAHETV